jgi:putative transposase
MSRSRHTEAQMIGALKQLEAGRKAEDVAREVGVSKHTIYAWKAKYGGMGVSQLVSVQTTRSVEEPLKAVPAASSPALELRKYSVPPPPLVDQAESMGVPIDRVAAHRVFFGQARRFAPVHESLVNLVALCVRADCALVFVPSLADALLLVLRSAACSPVVHLALPDPRDLSPIRVQNQTSFAPVSPL